MNGLGGLNKSPNGVVIGLVQLQIPVVATPADPAAQCRRICDLTAKARRGMPGMDLVVFPEYSLHGLSMDTNPAIMCRLDGPEVAAFRAACARAQDLGLLLDHGAEPARQPLQQRHHHRRPTASCGSTTASCTRGCRSSRGSPATSASPCATDRTAASSALIICHDGMFPEMARECAYKGAEIMIRTAGYTAPIRHAWRITNQANAFCNLMYTASVCMCGSDGTFDSMGEAMIVDFDGVPLVDGRRPPRRDRHRRGAARPGARGAAQLGRREQHLPARPPRLRRGQGRRARLPLHVHAATWSRAATACPGRTRSSHSDGTVVRLPGADARIQPGAAGTNRNDFERLAP